jgi:hypothetical protein
MSAAKSPRGSPWPHTEGVTQRPSPARRVLTNSPFPPPKAIPKAATRMSAGDRVTHDRLGLGRVVRVGDDVDVIVDFGQEDGSLTSIAHFTLTRL